MEKKRIYYLDVLRAFAFAMIVLYHFMVESEGIFSFVAMERNMAMPMLTWQRWEFPCFSCFPVQD